MKKAEKEAQIKKAIKLGKKYKLMQNNPINLDDTIRSYHAYKQAIKGLTTEEKMYILTKILP